jgi:hypothetical protein
MAPRTTAQLLARFERFLPDEHRPLQPLHGGLCAALGTAEAFLGELATAATLGGSVGTWLALHARGRGVLKGSDETDATLLSRLRRVEAMLTPPAIVEAVDGLLALYTGERCELVEHWDAGVYCDSLYCDGDDALYGEHNAFTLIVPRLVFEPGASDFLDQAYCDGAYADAGTAGEWDHPVYALIAAEVNRRKAAGVRWWMALAALGESQQPYVGEDGFYLDSSYLGDSA